MTDAQDAPPSTGRPYAAAAATYWAAGWRGVLPLPPRRKGPVPTGWTGTDGAWPSYADVHAWTEDHPDGNLALRLPPGVIGIDVDQYGGKPGYLVLQSLEAKLCALPATWRSTSRDDGMSGIRLYRIPEGLRWPGVLGPGIEVLRTGHRYAVAWPSIHPDTGGTYRWITPDGATALEVVPSVDDLPDLPDAWVDHFTHGELASEQPRASLSTGAAGQWLAERGQGPCCRHMQSALDRAISDLTGASSRHDATLSATNRLVWLAGEGHTGANGALVQLRSAFLKALTGSRAEGDAEGEWDRMIAGAVRIAAAAHPDVNPDPCDDPFHGLIPKDSTWTTPTTPSAPAAEPPSSTQSAEASSAPTTTATTGSATDDLAPASREVATRLRPGGAFILDIPDNVPAIWGRGDSVLWADGEALTICGPAGVGKTTLTGQVLRARLVGGEVLELPVQPTGSRVLYLAMDRPRQIARALRRTLGDLPREVLDERLVVWPGPPIADVAAHPETLLGLVQLAGADTVIIDSIKDAAVGLSSDEVGAGYNRARQMCIAEGIQVLEQHHMVKKGENGAKPNSLADLYGSVWIGAGAGSVLLIFGAAGDPIVDMKHLKTPAEEVGPWRLAHDHQAGVTTIWHQTDLLAMAKACGSRGLTAKAAASALYEQENPKPADVQRARRRLDELVEGKHLLLVEGSKGGVGGGQAAAYIFVEDPLIPSDHAAESDHESDHARDRPQPTTNRSRAITQNHVSAGQSDHGSDYADHTQTDHVSLPPFKGEGTVGGRVVERVVAGERVKLNLDTGEMEPV